VWTITVHEGVEFHDGTPLDARILRDNLDAIRSAPLTAPALSNIAEVTEAGPRSVEVRMHEPWVPFPQYLTGQVGVVMAPAMLDGDQRDPIGTGPFVFDSWVFDNRLRVERNENYWRTDHNGDPLPYLDAIEFLPLPDPTTRRASFDSGDLHVMHTYTADHVNDFRDRAERGDISTYESCAWGEDEEFLLMFNNGAEPFDDPVAREAVARAVNRELLIENLFGDTFAMATGPWAPGSPWYVEPDEPDIHDPQRARELVEQYEQTHGKPLRFTLRAPASIPEARQSQELTQQFLEAVGIQVELETVEFAQYLADAVLGNYQANIWRQFGAVDPDGEYVWWHPDNVSPPGQFSLNIARIDDPAMGEALDRGRRSADPDERREAYADVQQIFRENFYLGWTVHAFWSVAAHREVRDLVNWTAPGGQQGLPLSGGVHPLAQVWLDPS
jgi:peptide/nickel transport system substrate-binding protein